MKKTYLLVLGVICLLSFAMYSTYAMFTQDVNIGQFVNLTASNLSATESSIQKYERLTLEAGESKKIDLNITNSTSSSLYYGVWYEMIEPSTINNDITIAKLDESANPIIGQLTTSQTKTVTLYLENNTNDDIIVNIGVGYSETNSLNLPTGRTIITAEASEAIDGDSLPQPFVENFEYTGAVQTYNITDTGNYKLEVWGAQGGSGDTNTTGGGLGGYSYGTVTLNQGDILYVYTGGQGSASATSSTTRSGAGFNANAAGVSNAATGANGAGGGGGASDIRIGADSINHRVIVAGGGGGKCGSTIEAYCAGGVGGGTTGGRGVYQASTTTNTAYAGQGGTQTAGGARGTYTTYGAGQAGGFGYGGYGGVRSTSSRGSGAGGGGWYGGGGGAYRYGGGGGGSGYVWTSATASSAPSSYALSSSYYMTDAATIAGNDTSGNYKEPDGTIFAGHSGNGYARITNIPPYPTMTGLTTKRIILGTNVDLTSDVTCIDNGDGCTFVRVSITNTSTLAEGTYTAKYIVKDNNNVKYQYTRTLNVIPPLDDSGANIPNLVDGLIPVTYYNNNWVKADTVNKNGTYKWYDYDAKQWANAVLVSSTNRSTYQNANAGTTIPESDVLAYYVWIPRYKYKVWNINKVIGTDSYNAQTTGVDIVFETGTAKTGTINCSYGFSVTATDSVRNETCTGSNGDYYTHPAFWWDMDGDSVHDTGEELEGIWVGKFEISSETPTATNGGEASTTLTVRVKPNVKNWRFNELTNYYKVIYDMQKSSNIYGLSTDRTNTDSHMLKNTEWGAVAYLTNSKYGRCSNNTCSEVTVNSESLYTGGNNYVTNVNQSTTGNIYGIYDMSGGAAEYVMGNMSSASGNYTYYASEGGSNFSYSTSTARYIDRYAYGSSNTDQTAFNRARLGDATGEVILTTGSSNGAWYSSCSIFVDSVSPWFMRNINEYGDTYNNAGLFSFSLQPGSGHEIGSTRAAIIGL